MRKTILLTGATGFIGSHICQSLLRSGHRVFATCRDRSVFDKCGSFKSKVIWLNQDQENWQQAIEKIELDLLIHTAWSGVYASERDNWELQLTNFKFSKSILDTALGLKVKKIICLGSQAEYGDFEYNVNENQVPYPLDAYGAVKLLTLYYLRSLALKQKFEWYWLRVFSIIGENENEAWLLSQVMNKLLAEQDIELTGGGQRYDYLYIADFIKRLNQVIESEADFSGVYNICSGRSTEIRQLLLLTAKKLTVSSSHLKFGALPYRENQNMYMVGSPEKFESRFGVLAFEGLEETVSKITTFYKSRLK